LPGVRQCHETPSDPSPAGSSLLLPRPAAAGAASSSLPGSALRRHLPGAAAALLLQSADAGV